MPAARVLITPTPFAAVDQRPLEMLSALGVDYLVNPLGAKPTEEQLLEFVEDVDAIIAGTEPITDRVMANAPRLRLISRLGVGLDNVDLDAARRRSIAVSYTPAAPVPAVAEMTIGMMLVLLRSLHVSNARMHKGEWSRIIGRRISEVTIGVVGVGPIGTMVLRYLSALGVSDVLLHDVNPDPCLTDNVPGLAFEWVTLDRLLAVSDVVTLHLPLTESTKNLVGFDELISSI
jgi:D-3-phosphoglycerate dehydrogenase